MIQIDVCTSAQQIFRTIIIKRRTIINRTIIINEEQLRRTIIIKPKGI